MAVANIPKCPHPRTRLARMDKQQWRGVRRALLGAEPPPDSPLLLQLKNNLPYVAVPAFMLFVLLGPKIASGLERRGLPGPQLVVASLFCYAGATLWTIWHHPSRRRARFLREEAERRNLEPGLWDFDLRSIWLLGADPTGAVENPFRGSLGRGSLGDIPVEAFDYWNATERRWMARHKWFACAAAAVPISGPRLIVHPRDGLNDLENTGLTAIEMELEAFNRAYEVRCDDPRFATALLDQRLLEAIQELQDWGFEVHEQVVLAAKRTLGMRHQDRVSLESALHAVSHFIDHIPEVAYELFPARVR